ncbi:prepilin peptidase [Pseudomaricurvus alkylphenolicus]|uniref:preprotein translocase subunit SecA n=1 Tax=Pseudomaricurvus alkylphenolicus TaxID=1306991 RepID=UPI00141DCCD6|nr:prepilin peptidase [Pseudomaricurvus alkylphenolicus]NIB44503.1 prepilin peptidase [Pseudomaricurvus alkylphenolicus]
MSSLATSYRRTKVRDDEALPSGADGLAHDIIGFVRRSRPSVRIWMQQVQEIIQRSQDARSLTDEQLTARLSAHRHRHRVSDGLTDEMLLDALGCIAEAADRTLGKRPYPVQLVGALALHHNYVAEMLPGEGKTLTASLAGVMAGWRREPCHIITANDYLAQRDAELMAALYHRCGVSVGCVTLDLKAEQRAENYSKDVVYVTSKELLGDFLRDQMVLDGVTDPDRRLIRKLSTGGDADESRITMRGLHTAIVDEADSVLVDDSTTPLIISVPGKNRLLKDAALAAKVLVSELKRDIHYLVDDRHKVASLTNAGVSQIDALTDLLPPLWQSSQRRQELVRQAISAREFYHRNRQYAVVDGEVVIVDEKTGRLQPGRSWSYGLHQAVEAKEEVELSDPAETHARLSFQRFFRKYQRLSGMSGTLQGTAQELWRVYRLPVVKIPPRVPLQRKVLPACLFFSKEEKWNQVVDSVSQHQRTGRPVLVGTRSIVESEFLAQRLEEIDIPCNVLNALHHEEEARIVELAGQRGRVTIATNMAGRGTDILLGEGVAHQGGLHVIATELHESQRVDWQLFGRCGRQGEPGSAQSMVSIEDDVISQYTPRWLQRVVQMAFTARFGRLFAGWVYARAQRKAERYAYRMRNRMLQQDFLLSDSLSFTGFGSHSRSRSDGESI